VSSYSPTDASDEFSTIEQQSWNRYNISPFLALVLLAGGALALAWWDWAYPGQIVDWWNGDPVYRFYWRQLGWTLLVGEGICLSLWTLAVYVGSRGSEAPVRAARPFLLGPLALVYLTRYTLHPFGVQYGSCVWTYGLVAVTAGVVALSLSPAIARAWGAFALYRGAWLFIAVFVLLYASVYGFLSLSRHVHFRSHALDLGTMDQAAWNTIHGRILERTPLYRHPAEGSRYESRLLDAKLELLFILLSALYWVWADPRTLLTVQTLFLAVSALPLYLLVRSRAAAPDAGEAHSGQSALLATLLATTALLYLPLHYVNMADFHVSALMVPLLIATWWAMTRRRWGLYYLFLVLALSCRIDAAFAALVLGIVIALRGRGYRRHGLYTSLLAFAWLAINFGVIVPRVREAYGPGAGNLVARRFSALGGDVVSVSRALVTRPSWVISQLTGRDKLQTIIDLLAPLGFVPLLYPPALLPALPVLTINLLAESTWQNSIHAHYMAPVIPFLWIAAGEGLNRMARRRGWPWALSLATFAGVSALLAAVAFSPFPPGKSFRLPDYYQPSAYVENLRAVAAFVPESATLCAQSDIHPHVSQRRDVPLFPRCQLTEDESAEYVILDLDAASTKSPLGYHTFYELVRAWLAREDYGAVVHQGGVLLLRRGAPRDEHAQVLAALDEYGRTFYRIEDMRADLPRRLVHKELYRVSVTVRNAGSQCWHSRGQLPVRLAYRWWTQDGALLAVDALRSDLPHRVAPGNEVRLRAWLLTPAEPGQYTLEWDLLREGDAWFGDMGATMLRQEVTIE
jgi:uncharacterized membrane protein